MVKNVNNKGYMLVEIILASALAMVVAYFMIDLTIKLKNKNDDLLVKTLVYTDQAIIYNTIMKDLYTTTDTINCSYVNNKLNISGNVFEYDGFKNVISEYASLEDFTCEDTGTNSIRGEISIKVKQLPDEVFDVLINFGKIPEPSEPTPTPTPTPSVPTPEPETEPETEPDPETEESDSGSGSAGGGLGGDMDFAKDDDNLGV